MSKTKLDSINYLKAFHMITVNLFSLAICHDQRDKVKKSSLKLFFVKLRRKTIVTSVQMTSVNFVNPLVQIANATWCTKMDENDAFLLHQHKWNQHYQYRELDGMPNFYTGYTMLWEGNIRPAGHIRPVKGKISAFI